MDNQEKLILLTKLYETRDLIPTPPSGREIALVKTKLDEAILWLKEAIENS